MFRNSDIVSLAMFRNSDIVSLAMFRNSDIDEKMRLIKKIELFPDSMEAGNALASPSKRL